MVANAIRPAFRDSAREQQAVFRKIMDAMAHPGRIVALDAGFEPPAPLSASAAAILLTLADYETPVWLDAPLMATPDAAAFLRFHTGAKLAGAPGAASFALIADPAGAPPLSAFAQGLPDYPDRSTTVIYQVQAIEPEGWRFSGSGIEREATLSAGPLPQDFAAQLADNRARFPLGVDVIFAAPGAIAALPRSVRLMEAR